MTDPTLVAAAIAAAIVTVTAALGGMIIQIINAWSAATDRREAATERRILLERTNATAKVTDETAKKADHLIEKAAEIHTLTNGTNSELTKALALARQENDGLRELMASQGAAKDDAEAARVRSERDIATALATPPPGLPGGPERRRASQGPIKVDIVSVPKDVLG